ncbi:MAG: hypothetical protein AB1801_11755, partial [Chloroflexota bacterium]
MKLWPFGTKESKNGGALPAPATSSVPPMPPIKQQALLYLDATLAVLRREGIPLARPVHGRPARGARFIEIP